MDTLQILKGARALISDKNVWAKYAMAVDINGREVSVESPDAACFCSLGAIRRAAGCPNYSSDEMSAREAVRAVLTGGHSIASFNDTHTHDEVLDLFDRAIARAESEAA